MGYIYKITNTISGKLYVGETAQEDPYVRWKGHQEAFRRGRGCPALRDAVKKYGIENFRFEVLVICFDDARFDMEREYIKRLNTMVPNGYNILEGGLGGAGFKGKTHSEEVRKVISEHNKKRLDDPEYRLRLSERAKAQMRRAKEEGVNWGEKVVNSVKYKKALEEGRVGCAGRLYVPSEESCKKIGESLKKYYSTEVSCVNVENHRRAMAKAVGVKVIQMDLDGNCIALHDSIAEAARKNGMNKGSIQFCLSGKCKTAGGFKWKRVTESTVAESKIEHVEAT